MKAFSKAVATAAVTAALLAAPAGLALAADSAPTPDAATVTAVHTAAYEAAIYDQMLHAANLAIVDRDADTKENATVGVEAEQGGMGPAGVVMLVGGGLMASAVATGVVVVAVKNRKKEGTK